MMLENLGYRSIGRILARYTKNLRAWARFLKTQEAENRKIGYTWIKVYIASIINHIERSYTLCFKVSRQAA